MPRPLDYATECSPVPPRSGWGEMAGWVLAHVLFAFTAGVGAVSLVALVLVITMQFAR